ncbi:hypothetical protein K490DRAFT_65576 [Saccharata proteae CBS 121410]|uniref:Uncharacterized protein n=1 Tax=Saccharata proteae CBS 121410 TaxID=1314787 RepID=A0A9P4LX42_9PEZI|nr:hypothetical protein K490DRAFT_65576 [Saccharata proteae CBS 121410]
MAPEYADNTNEEIGRQTCDIPASHESYQVGLDAIEAPCRYHYANVDYLTQPGQELSLRNVWQNDVQSPKADFRYAEDVVNNERVHQYYDRPDSDAATTSAPEQRDNSVKLYHSPQSSCEPPLRRFLTMSPKDDPLRWHSNREMGRLPVEFGSMESVQMRQQAAETCERAARVKQLASSSLYVAVEPRVRNRSGATRREREGDMRTEMVS